MRKCIGYLCGGFFLILAIVAFALGAAFRSAFPQIIVEVEKVLEKLVIFDPAPKTVTDCGYTTEKDCLENFCIWTLDLTSSAPPAAVKCVIPATGTGKSYRAVMEKVDNFDPFTIYRSQTDWWLYDITNTEAVRTGAAAPALTPIGPLTTYSSQEYVQAYWDFEKGTLTSLTRDFSWPKDPTDPLWSKEITMFNLGFIKALDSSFNTIAAMGMPANMAHALKGQFLTGSLAAGAFSTIKGKLLANGFTDGQTGTVGPCMFNTKCGGLPLTGAAPNDQCSYGLMGASFCMAGLIQMTPDLANPTKSFPYGIPSPAGPMSPPKNIGFVDGNPPFPLGISDTLATIIASQGSADLAPFFGILAGWTLPTGATYTVTSTTPLAPDVNTIASGTAGSDGCGLYATFATLSGPAAIAQIAPILKGITCTQAHDLRQYVNFLAWYATFSQLVATVKSVDPGTAVGLFVKRPVKEFMYTGHSCALATGSGLATNTFNFIPPISTPHGEAFGSTFSVPPPFKLRFDPGTRICGPTKNGLCSSNADHWRACYELRTPSNAVSVQNAAQIAAKCPSMATFTKVMGKYGQPGINARLGEVTAKNGKKTQSVSAVDTPVEGYSGSSFPPGAIGKIFIPGFHGEKSERPQWPESLKIWNDNFGRTMTFTRGQPIEYTWNGYADISIENYEFQGMPRFTVANGFSAPKKDGVADPSVLDDASWVPECMINLKGQVDAYFTGGNMNFYGCSAAQITSKGYSLPSMSNTAGPLVVPSTDNALDGVTLQIEPISGKPVKVTVSIGPYVTYTPTATIYSSVKSTIVPYYGGSATGGMLGVDKDAVGAGYFIASQALRTIVTALTAAGVALLIVCVLPCFLIACTARPKEAVTNPQ